VTSQTPDNTTTATFTDDTAILAIASVKLQATINKNDDYVKKWRIKINQSKSTHITFTLHNQTCPKVQMVSADIASQKRSDIPGHASRQKTDMGKAHQNQKKPAQPKGETKALATQKKINTINRKQTPPIQSSNEPHMDLWNSPMGAASNSNIEILQRFQSKTLQSILNASWYINNHRIHEDLKINTVLSEIPNT
jgi:hypothetical protein